MYNIQISSIITDEDIKELAQNMREEEVKEVFASSGRRPLQAVQQSVDFSKESFVAKQDGQVVCISGIFVPGVLSNTACPWLLTTNLMKKNTRALLSHSKETISKWSQEYKVLTNYVDTRYKQSLRWAKWVGFTVHEAQPFGPFLMPFHKIQIGEY